MSKGKHMERYHTELITSAEEVLEVLAENAAIDLPGVEAPSVDSFWVSAYVRNLIGDTDIACVLYYEEGRLTCMLPGQFTAKDAIKFLVDGTSDYNDFLYFAPSERNPVTEILRFLGSMGIESFYFHMLPPKSPTLSFLADADKETGLQSNLSVCHAMPLREVVLESDVEQWPEIKVSRIQDYKQMSRRLNRTYQTEFKVIRDYEALSPWLEQMFDLHVQRWAKRDIESSFAAPAWRQFTRDICQGAAQKNKLFCPVLLLDNQLAAYAFSFCGPQTVFYWVPSFDLQFEKYSVGGVMLLQIFHYLTQQGKPMTFNFLRGDEPYKFFWANRTENSWVARLTKFG